MADLKHTLRDRVRKMAFRTSVDELRKRGVEKVNVLGLDRIVNLIEEAVRRSLKDHMVGLDSDKVARDAKNEFVQLLRNNADLKRDKAELERRQQEVEAQLASLRTEISSNSQALADKLDEPLENKAVLAAEDARIASRIREAFSAIDTTGDRGEAEQRVLAMVMGLVNEERSQTSEAAAALRDQEVEMLQRRISKLNSSLEITERKLSEVASSKGLDDGVASIYREVQGLQSGDEHAGKKRELMKDIFQANLALKQSMTPGPARSGEPAR